MKIVFVCLLCVISCLAAPTIVEDPTPIDFKICGANHLGITQIAIEPDPPEPGKDLIVAITGKSDVDITDGELDLNFEVFGIKIASLNLKMCSDMHVSCPIKAGQEFNAKISYPIPPEAPRGTSISVHAKSKDGKGSELACFKIEIHMGFFFNDRMLEESSESFLFEHHRPLFNKWQTQHEKSYVSGEEEDERLRIFSLNAHKVQQHRETESEWQMGLNEFADLTEEEFGVRYGLLGPNTIPGEAYVSDLEADLPTSVDWRNTNMVTDVKNQGSCGSCWAFSTVVSVEGQHAKQTGKLVSLSEQDLVDCVKSVKIDDQVCCDGCQGGLMDYAMKYMIDSQNGGDATESSYPYTGSTEKCMFKKSEIGAKITGYVDVKKGDEKELKNAVATIGPISIGVDANLSWQLYYGGIMNPGYFFGCSADPAKMDHGVAIVGYGTENGQDYWIVRNSWGPSWGEKGYIRIIAGKNACGIANAAVYPKVSKI